MRAAWWFAGGFAEDFGGSAGTSGAADSLARLTRPRDPERIRLSRAPTDAMTTLDADAIWFLEAAVYDGHLTLQLAEALPSDTTDGRMVGDAVVETHPLEVTEASRCYDLRFEAPTAWQVVDEEVTGERAPGVPVVELLEDSPYLGFIRESCGWFSEGEGRVRHWRVWTLEEVVDVVSTAEPSLEAVERQPRN